MVVSVEKLNTEFFSSLNFSAEEGSVCKLIAGSVYEKNIVIDSLARLRRPLGGTVRLFGRDIYEATYAEAVGIYKNVGIVWKDGGLISNLKVWENIMLPAGFHWEIKPSEAEPLVASALDKLGLDPEAQERFLQSSPAAIPENMKEYAGLLRAILMEPDLMIYDSVFEGVGRRQREAIYSLAESYHAAQPGRTSIYISASEHTLDIVETENIIRLVNA